MSRMRGGFSLLEMLIVIAILGLIATLVYNNLGGSMSKAKVKTTQTQIASTASAIEQFHMDVGRYPTIAEMDGYRALIDQPSDAPGWDGPYLEKNKAPTDGWERELVYELDEKWGFVVKSYGADGKPGGEDENSDLDNRS
ncbi:MAG: type II secretion system major pseudopilin GspG [Phycisphaerales bacterium]